MENNENLIWKKNKEGENAESFKIDFDMIIEYYSKVTKLRQSIKYSMEFSISFWNSILNRQEINSIKASGLEFYKWTNQAELTYDQINAIYRNLFEVNKLYNDYRFFVFGERNQLLNDGLNTGISSTVQFDDTIYNNRSTLIIANVFDRNKAIIEKISDNVFDFLGYNPSECLNQDIKLLMPNYYKQRHSSFVNIYFETGVNKIMNKQRMIYALHSVGYAVPVNMIVKILPSLSQTIYCTSLIRDYPIDYEFILTNRTGKIEMISRNLYRALISDHSLFNSVDYYIHFLCKEYLNEIVHLTIPTYEITDFTNNISLAGKYRYTLLHFKSDTSIENIVKEVKTKLYTIILLKIIHNRWI